MSTRQFFSSRPTLQRFCNTRAANPFPVGDLPSIATWTRASIISYDLFEAKRASIASVSSKLGVPSAVTLKGPVHLLVTFRFGQ